jgi:hypothetical protein
MLSPSPEQQEIIECVKNGFNVLVDAVAGSGKTTTVLFLAHAVPEKKITLFTYNSRLKAETRERVRALGLTNIEVHSYHSFGVAHYKSQCVTDADLNLIMTMNMPLKNNFRPNIVIMDETQDMTPLYFQFIHKALTDMNKMTSQLLVLGDNMQCIYDFPQKGADLRFLTMAEQLYTSPYEWKKRNLRTSYRITRPMEYFINEVVLGYPRMKSVKGSAFPVEYITGNVFFKMPEYVYKQIMDLLTVYKPDDIFILAPSVRTHNEHNPIKILENTLVKRGIPCYVPISDDSELRDEALVNKVVFSSFHQSKGLERKGVHVISEKQDIEKALDITPENHNDVIVMNPKFSMTDKNQQSYKRIFTDNSGKQFTSEDTLFGLAPCKFNTNSCVGNMCAAKKCTRKCVAVGAGKRKTRRAKRQSKRHSTFQGFAYTSF